MKHSSALGKFLEEIFRIVLFVDENYYVAYNE